MWSEGQTGWQRAAGAVVAVALAVIVARSGPADAGAASPAQAAAAPTVPAGTTTLLDSGAWSWFEDERVIIDARARRLYVSAVADRPTPGEVVVSEVDLATGARRTVSLGAAELDDHNSAAIWEAATSEVLTAWARHHRDDVIRTHRRRTDGSWLRLPPVVDPSRVTYNNLYSVLAEDGSALLYDFYRGSRFDPQAMASVDAGRTWSRLGSVLRDPTDSTAERPYVRYTSRGDRIDLIATERHPDTGRTSIYHGFIRDGLLHTSAGAVLGPVGSGVPVTSLTRVGSPGPGQTAWTVDIGYDPASGHPIAAYSTTVTTDDHRYHVARWDGSNWRAREVAFAGRALYPVEESYTGLMALDPRDAGHVVISTDANPTTGAPLVSATDGRRHWELFDGRLRRDGSYAWTPLTANSTQDNLRPVMTAGPGGASALAWMRGRYTTYTDYRLEVVGVVRRANGSTVATGPAGPRLSVVAGIAAPPVLDTAGVPLAGDFDAHPADDFSLYRGGTAREDLVIGDDGGWPVFAQARQVSGSGYRPVAGDFDGDGDDDVLWHGPGTALDSLWLSRPDGTSANAPVTQVGGTYTPLAGDYDADGDDDILWYAPGGGQESVWLAQGGRFTSRTAPAVSGTYRPAVGDADADGDDDIFWHAPGPATDHQWLAQGGGFTSRQAPPVNGTYTPVAGDYDADGDDDILWYAPGTTAERLWVAQAGGYTSRSAPAANGTYRPVALDLDGNGAEDVLWYGVGARSDHLWSSGPTPFARRTPSPVAL
jgi:BNR repeat-containing family member/FG-GAP-like repeat